MKRSRVLTLLFNCARTCGAEAGHPQLLPSSPVHLRRVQQGLASRTHAEEADIHDIPPQNIGLKIPFKRFDSPNAAG
jgi:hypothetical protein